MALEMGCIPVELCSLTSKSDEEGISWRRPFSWHVSVGWVWDWLFGLVYLVWVFVTLAG